MPSSPPASWSPPGAARGRGRCARGLGCGGGAVGVVSVVAGGLGSVVTPGSGAAAGGGRHPCPAASSPAACAVRVAGAASEAASNTAGSSRRSPPVPEIRRTIQLLLRSRGTEGSTTVRAMSPARQALQIHDRPSTRPPIEARSGGLRSYEPLRWSNRVRTRAGAEGRSRRPPSAARNACTGHVAEGSLWAPGPSGSKGRRARGTPPSMAIFGPSAQPRPLRPGGASTCAPVSTRRRWVRISLRTRSRRGSWE